MCINASIRQPYLNRLLYLSPTNMKLLHGLLPLMSHEPVHDWLTKLLALVAKTRAVTHIPDLQWLDM